MTTDRYKLTVNRFTCELSEPLERSLRSLVSVEVDIYSEETPDNGDGSQNRVWKAKCCGTTIVKQGTKKPILAKSKRSQSQKLRSKCWGDDPSEKYYERFTNQIILHYDEIKELLKTLSKENGDTRS